MTELLDLQTAARRAELSVLRLEMRADCASSFRQFENRMFALFMILVAVMCTMLGMLLGLLLHP